jgi:predicted ribonuclease YlaK
VAEIRDKDEGYKKAMTLDPVTIGRQLASTQNSQFQMVVDTINDERGTTYDNSIVIIDEAQNFKPYQLQSMIGGMGHDSLLVILGNVSQIDADLNGYYNGLAQAMSNLRGAPNVYQLRLLESSMVKRGVIATTVAEYWPYA